jgi:hypothetical protein
VQHNDLYDLFMQDNDLSEFDESREIIESLVDEYKACESPDYIKWGMEVSLLPFKFFYFYFFSDNSEQLVPKQDSGEGNVAAALDSKLVV